MLLGKVIGTLTPCVVYKGLEGVPLLRVQPLDGAGEVVTKRLFDHYARVFGAGGLHSPSATRLEQAGRNGQVVDRASRGTELLFQLLIRGRVIVVAVDILQSGRELGEGFLVDAAAMFDKAGPRSGRAVGRASNRPWPRRSPACRDRHVRSWPAARGRSSCRPDPPWHRKRRARRRADRVMRPSVRYAAAFPMIDPAKQPVVRWP